MGYFGVWRPVVSATWLSKEMCPCSLRHCLKPGALLWILQKQHASGTQAGAEPPTSTEQPAGSCGHLVFEAPNYTDLSQCGRKMATPKSLETSALLQRWYGQAVCVPASCDPQRFIVNLLEAVHKSNGPGLYFSIQVEPGDQR